MPSEVAGVKQNGLLNVTKKSVPLYFLFVIVPFHCKPYKDDGYERELEAAAVQDIRAP